MTASWRGLILPGVGAGVAFGILVSLGVWQVRRLQWKEALIARVSERADAAPIPAPGADQGADLDMVELEYQPVSVGGRFLDQAEAHVFTVLSAPRGPYGGMGYLVMTPLETTDGWIVYVNRGFVPEDRKDPTTRPDGQIGGEELEVIGLLRAPRSPTLLSAGDDTAGNVWFSRDPALFAAWGGLAAERVAPYTIDISFDPGLVGGLPQGGETLVQFPNNHLGYALTWFGLAGGLAAVFVIFARGRLRGR
jgi:surfeit locus 1 family protein